MEIKKNSLKFKKSELKQWRIIIMGFLLRFQIDPNIGNLTFELEFLITQLLEMHKNNFYKSFFDYDNEHGSYPENQLEGYSVFIDYLKNVENLTEEEAEKKYQNLKLKYSKF